MSGAPFSKAGTVPSSAGWEAVIGLEIHVQLKTDSKLFSGSATAYGAEPNSQVSWLDAALPGTLPVVNEKAIRYAVRFGLAVGATISRETVFARKNYFYPDLPKGYQISQLDHPIVEGGSVTIALGEEDEKIVRLTRAHLEEDAGKSIHDLYPRHSAIDLNRAGTPLIEVVSEPDMRSAAEAVAYMRQIYTLVTHLGICDGNLQEGSFRCDANVSVRPAGSATLGTRTELKNINSFRFVERAINHEIWRQIRILENGGQIVQETRLYDAEKDETRSMRSKEEANDYRYFPDPDLLPVRIDDELIEDERQRLPELPQAKIRRYIQEWHLKPADARLIAEDKACSAVFEVCVAATQKPDPVLAGKWLLGEVSALLNRDALGWAALPVSPQGLAGLLDAIASDTISHKIGKDVLEKLWQSPSESAAEIIDREGLGQVSDNAALEALVDDVLQANPKQVADFQNGNEKLFNFFVGQVMKATRGTANPVQLKKVLQNKLNS